MNIPNWVHGLCTYLASKIVPDDMPGEHCDGSLANTFYWLEREGFDIETYKQWLLDHGGGCDCEVLLNIGAQP